MSSHCPDASDTSIGRRTLLSAVGGAGLVLLTGCTSQDADANQTEDGTDTSSTEGTFRLLISDQPAAIETFDSLTVTFSEARIFPASSAAIPGNETDTNQTRETNRTRDPDTNQSTDTTQATDNETDDDSQPGFFIRDLDGASVDLTEVVGDKATPILEDTLPAGTYTKIELYASEVDGVVDGESVSVMLPSGKLQITTSFEVVAGEALDFVFDITVVERGQTGEYNLQPVISESGVAGRDVTVEEVGGPAGGPDGSTNASDNRTPPNGGGPDT